MVSNSSNDSFHTPDQVDGTDPRPGSHLMKSMIIGDKNGPWIPFPSHSILVYLGPKVSLLAIDCRAERRLGRIVTPETYNKVFGEVRKMKGIEQLVILLGVPIGESLDSDTWLRQTTQGMIF